jgi:hypothetical protein
MSDLLFSISDFMLYLTSTKTECMVLNYLAGTGINGS